MRPSKHLLIGVSVLGILLTATPGHTQENQGTPFILLSPDQTRLFSLEGVLSNSDPLADPELSVWFQELSPLELALLPKGAWIDPRTDWIGSWGRTPRNFKESNTLASEEALDAWEKEITSKALDVSAEVADSLRAPYLSQGIAWTKATFSSYQNALNSLANRTRLRFKVSDKQAALRYDLQY